MSTTTKATRFCRTWVEFRVSQEAGLLYYNDVICALHGRDQPQVVSLPTIICHGWGQARITTSLACTGNNAMLPGVDSQCSHNEDGT